MGQPSPASPPHAPSPAGPNLPSLAAPSRACHPATLPSLLTALSRARAARLPLLPTTRALAASALLRHGQLSDALAHFSLLPDSGALPAPLYNALLAELASSGKLAPARKVFNRLLGRAAELDIVGFGVFVNNVSSTDGLDEVLRLVEAVHHWGDWINRLVVAAMVVSGLCDCVGRGGLRMLEALKDMRLRGQKPDFVAYRIVPEGFR